MPVFRELVTHAHTQTHIHTHNKSAPTSSNRTSEYFSAYQRAEVGIVTASKRKIMATESNEQPPMSWPKEAKRTALVTGSSNGIGEAIVKQLAQLDYKLVVTGRNEADIRRVADLCAELSPSKSRVSKRR